MARRSKSRSMGSGSLRTRFDHATSREGEFTMSDPKDDDDKTPGAELREGLMHLFSAARKVIKTAEPAVTRSLDDAERVIGKIGRGGEVVANEVGKEVATLATKLAEKLRQVAN